MIQDNELIIEALEEIIRNLKYEYSCTDSTIKVNYNRRHPLMKISEIEYNIQLKLQKNMISKEF